MAAKTVLATLNTAPDEGSRTWVPQTPDECALVHAELGRILASPLFSHSKRYLPFLRFVVEATVAGRADSLKERNLGVEIFGRLPDYDSSNDPVVRVTAGEVRRRIAQYYQLPEHLQQLRISMVPGSYVPEFIPLAARPPEPGWAADGMPVQPAESSVVGEAGAPGGVSGARRWMGAFTMALLLAAGLVYAVVRANAGMRGEPALDAWWRPAIRANAPVLLSVGTAEDGAILPPERNSSPLPGKSLAGQGNALIRGGDAGRVSLSEAIALQRLAALFARHDRGFRTLAAENTSYDDLRGGPAVLLSGLDNSWTMRVSDPLRFHFVQQGEVVGLVDRQHPGELQRSVDFRQPYTAVTKDFAIVARLHIDASEQPIFLIAGIGSNGTAAAAQFVSSEALLKAMQAHLPANWQDRNVEALLETGVVGGQAGPPELVAVSVW